jgi:hypothetical protein
VAGYPWEAVRNQTSYAAVVSFKRLPQTTSPRTMLYEGWGRPPWWTTTMTSAHLPERRLRQADADLVEQPFGNAAARLS